MELKEQFVGANHAEVVPRDAFDRRGIVFQGSDFAVEIAHFAVETRVVSLETLQLGAERTVTRQALRFEHAHRDHHDHTDEQPERCPPDPRLQATHKRGDCG